MQEPSDRELEVMVEPDDMTSISEDHSGFALKLVLKYPPEYPDVLPILALMPATGDITSEELAHLLDSLKESGSENLGLPLTFTLISHLKEQMADLLVQRLTDAKAMTEEAERAAAVAEDARIRGTLVTRESFKEWRNHFKQERLLAKQRAEQERMKGLTGKDREDVKKISLRSTGKQLFEKNRGLADSDEVYEEDGVTSVDFSQYERDGRPNDATFVEVLHLSDSD